MPSPPHNTENMLTTYSTVEPWPVSFALTLIANDIPINWGDSKNWIKRWTAHLDTLTYSHHAVYPLERLIASGLDVNATAPGHPRSFMMEYVHAACALWWSNGGDGQDGCATTATKILEILIDAGAELGDLSEWVTRAPDQVARTASPSRISAGRAARRAASLSREVTKPAPLLSRPQRL
jgi:hypothetical protein